MKTIIQKLEADIDQIRLLAALVTEESETVEVASLVESLVANLGRAKRCAGFYAADVVADWVRRGKPYEEMGFFYQPPVVPNCPEADAACASQNQLRELLAKCVERLEVKEARRIALLLVRSAKNEHRLLRDANLLWFRPDLDALRDDLHRQLREFKATMTTDDERERWAEFVDQQLGVKP